MDDVIRGRVFNNIRQGLLARSDYSRGEERPFVRGEELASRRAALASVKLDALAFGEEKLRRTVKDLDAKGSMIDELVAELKLLEQMYWPHGASAQSAQYCEAVFAMEFVLELQRINRDLYAECLVALEKK